MIRECLRFKLDDSSLIGLQHHNGYISKHNIFPSPDVTNAFFVINDSLNDNNLIIITIIIFFHQPSTIYYII